VEDRGQPLAASFDNRALTNGPGGVLHTARPPPSIPSMCLRGQCLVDCLVILLLLIVWSFSFIVYMFVTKVVLWRVVERWREGQYDTVLVIHFWFETLLYLSFITDTM
jgi:hypothetical protein